MTPAPADWPDRFVYVCTATRGAIVNLAPLYHAGADRLAGIVILRALASPNRATALDNAEAIEPSERLRKTAMEAFRLPKHRIRMLKGHADMLSDWVRVLDIAADMARDEGAAIVFNVTAGRKTTAIGALLGLPRTPGGPPLHLLTVGLDMTMRRIDLQPDGPPTERPLPAHPGLGLELYLGSYGVQMLNRDQRRQREARLEACRDAYGILAARLGNVRYARCLGDLQPRAARFDGAGPFDLSIGRQEADVLMPLVASVPGARLRNNTLTLDTWAKDFFAGLWLEGLALTALRKVIPVDGPAHLACGVEIAVRKTPRGHATTELDLAVLSGDRLALVECKAGRDTRGVRRGLVNLAHVRALLTAQAGAAWLVAPLISAQEAEAKGLKAQAEESGITLLTGPEAVTDLVSALAGWLDTPAQAPG